MFIRNFKFCYKKALEYYKVNDLVRAKKYLHIILKDDRNNPQANILLGEIYEHKNQINKSLGYYDIAIEELISQNYDYDFNDVESEYYNYVHNLNNYKN